MANKDQIDQDALAAEWGLALESEGAAAAPADEDKAASEDAAAAQWAAMVDESGAQFRALHSSEWNEYVIAKPICERDMPVAPKLSNVL